jgi:hypothetical protein
MRRDALRRLPQVHAPRGSRVLTFRDLVPAFAGICPDYTLHLAARTNRNI